MVCEGLRRPGGPWGGEPVTSSPRPPTALAVAIALLVALVSHGLLVCPAEAQTARSRQMFTLGLAKSSAGDIDGAIEAYTKTLALDPLCVDAYNNRGLLQAGKGNCDQAIADYNTAIRLDPRFALAFVNRSWCRLQQGDVRGAIADLDVHNRLQPRNPWGYFHRGNLKLELSDFASAAADYRRAIELKPGFAAAYLNLGCVFYQQGAFRRALPHFSKTIELAPDYALAWEYRARAKRNLGDLEGAIEDLTQAIRLDPGRAEASFERGMLHYSLGNYAAAATDLRRSCKLDPSDQDYPRLYLWLSVAAGGDRPAASAGLGGYLDQRPADAEREWYPLLAGFLLGRVDEEKLLAAAASTQADETRRGRQCEAHFYLGSVKLIDGQATKAEESFRQCLGTGMRGFVEFASAEGILQRLQKKAAPGLATGKER